MNTNQINGVTRLNNVRAFYLLDEFYQRNKIDNKENFAEIIKSVLAGRTIYEVKGGRILRVKGEFFIGYLVRPSGSLPQKRSQEM